MNENMSMTAEVSAFVRAYHTAEGGEICNDPLAVKLLGEGRFGQIAAQMTAGREWFLPGDTGTQEEALRRIVNQKLGPAVLARAAWWEQELRRELTMGLKQVLLLGAGLESLPCRQTVEMERMSFYEVDTPAVLAEKEKRLREVGITTPRNVYRVGVDLAEDWEKTLLEMTPFATEQRTLTALLGVVYYLPRAAMEVLLKRLAAITPRGSSLLFDCPMRDFGTGEDAAGQQRALAKSAGETMEQGYTLPELALMLERHGFLIYEDMGPREITERFYAGYNETHPESLVLPLPGTALVLAARH